MGLVGIGEFSVNKLKDYRQSYVELLNLKLCANEEMLGRWLPSLGLPTSHVQKLQGVFRDFCAARINMTNYPGAEPADTTRLVGRPQ